MRAITNDYKDAQILNLGSGGADGPYLVMQTGVDPKAEIPKTHMFVLRPDGRWADFNAYACQGKPEAMDEIVFPSLPQVMETFGKLSGRPQVAHLSVDETGLKKWLERQEQQNPLEGARAWAVEYKTRHGRQYDRLEGQRG
ncbi:MAG TPA: hypothetical protein VKS98_12025 [Chthoniobacterales bacterium]|nr:hypothetical protein [Chthoniobacterales bacterium]